MAIKRDTRTRSLNWEDDAPTDPRFGRAKQRVSANGRGLPDKPLEMPSFEDLDDPSGPSKRNQAARSTWWRPATPFSRAVLALGACSILAVTVYAYHGAKTFLEHDSRFRIAGSGNIEATGLGEVTRADFLPIFGEDIGRNVFFVPLAERRTQLEQIPWVESATVMRLLPNGIRVSLVERKPVAFVRNGQKIGLIDGNGVLLDMPVPSLAKHHYSFPVVNGINPSDPLAARKSRMDSYLRLIADLDSTGRHYSNQVSEIDLSDPEDAKVTLPAEGLDVVAHFGESDFLARYERYKSHIAEWRQQYPLLAEVDLRYGQQVVLEMNHGATSTTMPVEAAASPESAATQSIAPAPRSKPTAATGLKAPVGKTQSSSHPANAASHSPTVARTSAHSTTKSSARSKAVVTHSTKTARLTRQQETERRARLMREQRAKARRSASQHARSNRSSVTHHATSSGKGK